jgi:hypothetical protein
MLTLTFNTKSKAERIIISNKGRRKMHWQKFYYTDKDGNPASYYINFYEPKAPLTSL